MADEDVFPVDLIWMAESMVRNDSGCRLFSFDAHAKVGQQMICALLIMAARGANAHVDWLAALKVCGRHF